MGYQIGFSVPILFAHIEPLCPLNPDCFVPLDDARPLEIKDRDDAIEFTPKPSSYEVNLTEVGTDPDVAYGEVWGTRPKQGVIAARNYTKLKRFVTF
jgi:hypothetical protein